MTKKPADNKKGRTTAKKAVDIDKSKPWPVGEDFMNLKRGGQKEFRKKLGLDFLAAQTALDRIADLEAEPIINVRGEEVELYDIIVEGLALWYKQLGAEFDFSDEEEFGLGWLDLMDIIEMDSDPKDEKPEG